MKTTADTIRELTRKAEAEAGSAETEDQVVAPIPAKKLKDLMKSKRVAQKDIDSIAGTLGEEVKSAVDKHGLDRQIFGFCCSLDKRENEDIADKLRTLEYYLKASGLFDRAAKATARMDLGDQPGEEEADAEPKGRKKRGQPFPNPKGDAKD